MHLNTKILLAKVQEVHILEKIQQVGATITILRIRNRGKLVHMNKTWDTETRKMVTKEGVKRVAAQEAQKNNTLPKHKPHIHWVQGHMLASTEHISTMHKVAQGA